MKNGRTIRIKDPKLQKIRNNLRLIILEECAKRKSEFTNHKYDLMHDKYGNYTSPSEETGKIIRDLNDRWWEIERPLRASIVKCAVCGNHKKDMIYHQKSRSWSCADCYKASFG